MGDLGLSSGLDGRLQHSYADDLDGWFADVSPGAQRTASPDPSLVLLNQPLAVELGLDGDWLSSAAGLAVVAGNATPEGARPIAQAYAGHQFGQFSPMLGDGRALLLGELIDAQGSRRDLALKGSGRTPFSRGGDGKAVLGPVLREYLMGEAMHALGVPTTRALAAAATGERVWRDRGLEPGAILTRVAASHLRVGTFELFRRAGAEQVRRLADYAIARHYPDLTGDYPAFLRAVADRQAQLIASWMSIGFIHGVMNTDNMTISGETIDYGPCAFLDAYDESAVFSSIDHSGRYAFGNQPTIAAWNLARLAESLLPILHEDVDRAVEIAQSMLDDFGPRFHAAWVERWRAKLGLSDSTDDDSRLPDSRLQDSQLQDSQLIADLVEILRAERLDLTTTMRALANDLRGERDAVRGHLLDVAAYDSWRARWVQRLGSPGSSATTDALADQMDSVNPLYIPRNHLVEEALSAARGGDLAPLTELLTAVTQPFVAHRGWERLAEPGSDDFTRSHRTYCGT